jgi:hypothetical protein
LRTVELEQLENNWGSGSREMRRGEEAIAPGELEETRI